MELKTNLYRKLHSDEIVEAMKVSSYEGLGGKKANYGDWFVVKDGNIIDIVSRKKFECEYIELIL